MLLVGCKSDLRTDLNTLVELSNHRQMPVSYDQVRCQHSVQDSNALSVHAICGTSVVFQDCDEALVSICTLNYMLMSFCLEMERLLEVIMMQYEVIMG